MTYIHKDIPINTDWRSHQTFCATPTDGWSLQQFANASLRVTVSDLIFL